MWQTASFSPSLGPFNFVFLIQNFKCVLIYGIILYILFGFHRDFTFKNQISMWIYFPHLCIFWNVTFISLYNCMIWVPFIFSVMFHLSPWCFSWQYYTHLFNKFCNMGFPDISVTNPPAMQETPVRFLSREDPLENKQATHSSVLGLPLWLSW